MGIRTRIRGLGCKVRDSRLLELRPLLASVPMELHPWPPSQECLSHETDLLRGNQGSVGQGPEALTPIPPHASD